MTRSKQPKSPNSSDSPTSPALALSSLHFRLQALEEEHQWLLKQIGRKRNELKKFLDQMRSLATEIFQRGQPLYQTGKSQLEIGVSSQELRDRLYLPLLRRYEQKTVQKFSKIVVTTDDDQKQMEEFAPNGEIYLIPNAVDLDLFPYRTEERRHWSPLCASERPCAPIEARTPWHLLAPSGTDGRSWALMGAHGRTLACTDV